MEEILKSVSLINHKVEKETNTFLDCIDYEYKTPVFTISFDGVSVDIPIDFACINNTIQDFLNELEESITEYI